ncbi:MAG TPA: EAL domain-containing protein [Candidatus Eisenbacteria bacterium]|nr:EAL domain-containing protein [Candidatus Eisenbacteria bacterium]
MTNLRILHLEDVSSDSELIRRMLQSEGFHCAIKRVETREDFIEALALEDFDVILSDYNLPSFDGVSALAIAREKFPDVPFIFVSGAIGEDRAIEALKSGATDYVLKDKLSRLPSCLKRALRELADRKFRQQTEDQLRRNTLYDQLTGLPNRTLFLDRLGRAIERKKRNDYFFGVVYMDLDRFKIVNDSLGHAYGDALLIAVVNRIWGKIRLQDTLARLGGDEFALLLDGIQSVEDAFFIINRIQEAMKMPFDVSGREIFSSASMGVNFGVRSDENADDMLRDADIAMYRAKAMGEGHYVVYDSAMREDAVNTMEIETDLRRGQERDEFELYYQPIVRLSDGRITGAEALLRWRRPGSGLVLPGEFISIAEKTGLVLPIGEWVLRTACLQKKAWQQAGFPDLTVAVNVSARQFSQKELCATITRCIADSGIQPSSLDLELTESILTENTPLIIATMERLRKVGVRISIDDFGTGYSSLSYLRRFPINTLKVDRSFINDVPGDQGSAAIVRAIILLAHSMGLQVVAEGVEEEHQRAFLKAEGCDQMQGYLISRPVTADQFQEMLLGRSPAR